MPGRARAARCRIDARSSQDLIDGGRRDPDAELGQLAANAPGAAPQRILLRQPDDRADCAADCRRPAWLAPSARAVLPGGQFCGARRAGHREDLSPAPAKYQLRQRGEPHPVSRLVPDPPGLPPQHRVLAPEHQPLSILDQVRAEHQDKQAEFRADQQVDDLEQHPASQPSPLPSPQANARAGHAIEYSGGTGSCPTLAAATYPSRNARRSAHLPAAVPAPGRNHATDRPDSQRGETASVPVLIVRGFFEFVRLTCIFLDRHVLSITAGNLGMQLMDTWYGAARSPGRSKARESRARRCSPFPGPGCRVSCFAMAAQVR